jgi:hypothetical protein
VSFIGGFTVFLVTTSIPGVIAIVGGVCKEGMLLIEQLESITLNGSLMADTEICG